MSGRPPETDARLALAAARARLAAGEAWKAALEALLLALPEDEADRLQQVMREGRAAWLALLRTAGGRALFLGDPLSGTPVALAQAGFDVLIVARDPLALALARARASFDARRPVRVACGDPARPPVRERAFDLAVVEGDADPALARAALRASRGEVVLVADNRLAYKRWLGRRGAFRVRRPLELARAALAPRGPETTLAGYRARLAEGGPVDVRAYALYPHALDFALVARLDPPAAGGERPGLFVGPKERENRLKIAGHRLGLLPLFAPSFAVVASRVFGPARIERVLDALAEIVGEPRPRAEQWIATRGNTTVVQTAVPGRGEDDPAGRWTIHLAHQPYQERQVRRHYARLVELAARRPPFPAPAPLHAGGIAGLEVFCERRVPGLTAPQAVGRTNLCARAFADAARDLATLVVEPEALLDEARLDALVGAKVELVRRHAGVRSTEAWLDRARDEAYARLRGRRAPLVVQHADLRGKHVVIDARGRVTGYLDWGSSEDLDLPYFDLLHLVVHERKQAEGRTAGEAWRAVVRSPRPHERAALDAYAAAVGLDPDVRAALEALYPVLVAAMAERNWDYSRPRWLHASFGV